MFETGIDWIVWCLVKFYRNEKRSLYKISAHKNRKIEGKREDRWRFRGEKSRIIWSVNRLPQLDGHCTRIRKKRNPKKQVELNY